MRKLFWKFIEVLYIWIKNKFDSKIHMNAEIFFWRFIEVLYIWIKNKFDIKIHMNAECVSEDL